jgi:hypothetical protein
MKRTYAIAAVIFAALIGGTQAETSRERRVQKVAEAIKDADEASVVAIYTLSSCESSGAPLTRGTWAVHRELIISSMTKIYKDRDQALVRFDNIKKAAQTYEKKDDGRLCLTLLNEFQHKLETAVARIGAALKN